MTVEKELKKLKERVDWMGGQLRAIQTATSKDNSTPTDHEFMHKVVHWVRGNWGKVLSGLLALIVAGINFSQWHDAHVALEEQQQQWHDAHQTFEAEQRAWLKIHFEWPDFTNPESLTAVNVTFTNIGKATISRFDGKGLAQVLPLDVGPALTIKSLQGHGGYSNIISPGEPTTFYATFRQAPTTGEDLPISPQDMDDLRQGRKYMAAYGIVQYTDQFGPHWYRFCSYKAYSDSTKRMKVGACVNFNDIGEGSASLNW